MSDHHDHDELEDHDLGLSHDLPKILGRRGLLTVFGGVGVAVVAGCAADDASSTSTASASASSSSSSATSAGTGTTTDIDTSGGEIPEETGGPYPADGSNGPDVLTESGVVRSDIRSSFGDASGVAEGVPVTVNLTVYDLNGDDATPLAGAAIYLWHCDRDGNYSLYSDAAANENYLRGVQEAADDGTLSFTTIFPACYSGRWPHMHFEVYESLDSATQGTGKLRTSQLALPQDVCESVYATEGYEASVSNLAGVSLDSDMVFSDGYSLQMAKLTGSVEDGYVATLNVPV
ncbi:intradiol ring-cleavage dioxygenase [Nocardioides islandensis]|uniref:Intradiol ring-cleavage dioxygenase n=1 Tax=Nocardioides islandensis TaxID=433663 RepID=A0A930V7U3_9ACTN|nr:intradiol ring-cleavage dioxygenase [Nocardioides islandensis]MBF4761567.1 intradiol ring-cleavage dioxygenase [Nocardioides islandensis]